MAIFSHLCCVLSSRAILKVSRMCTTSLWIPGSVMLTAPTGHFPIIAGATLKSHKCGQETREEGLFCVLSEWSDAPPEVGCEQRGRQAWEWTSVLLVTSLLACWEDCEFMDCRYSSSWVAVSWCCTKPCPGEWCSESFLSPLATCFRGDSSSAVEDSKVSELISVREGGKVGGGGWALGIESTHSAASFGPARKDGLRGSGRCWWEVWGIPSCRVSWSQ